MATRTLLFDLSRLDGSGIGPASTVVHLSLVRPQQDGQTTITTTPYVLNVDGPTRVEVPVTAPGNALMIGWPAGASTSGRTYHLIPEGEGDLVAAELRPVDPGTLAPTAQPEAAWWAHVEGMTAPTTPDLTGYATTAYVDEAVAAIPAPTTQTVTDNGDGTGTIQIGA